MMTSIKKCLQFNVEPLNEILIKWLETSEERKIFLSLSSITINDILEQWPLYKQSFGHNLVNLICCIVLHL